MSGGRPLAAAHFTGLHLPGELPGAIEADRSLFGVQFREVPAVVSTTTAPEALLKVCI